MDGVRGRLTVTLVALVVVTAVVLGVGSYLFVDASLRQRFLEDREAQARFDLTEVIPARLSPDPTQSELDAVLEILRRRGGETVVDLGDGRPPPFLQQIGPALRQLAPGTLAYEWTSIAGVPRLVVGGRLADGPTFYFLHDASEVERALGTLRAALLAGAVVLAVLALIAARRVARGVLAPVDTAARAAERIERGDLSVRVPVTSRDEFGAWAEAFNRMAASLQETIGRLEVAQAQNRRFVSDVSHELRTPLTALVAEASILRDHLDALPPDARRTGELLVGDVARLRVLVDELMELSRFDAAAERLAVELVDLARLVQAIAASRAPNAIVRAPQTSVFVETEPRRLERILGNLLDNAREHAPGAPVEIRVRAEPGSAIVEVLDGGPGVPADRIDRIFDRFYKADPSRRGGSSGLGLAIAAEHAAILGGEIAAANRPRGGLRVALRLPVTALLPAGDDAATDTSQRMAANPPLRELQP